jgi:magnesium-protoporphyrin O-methyltransferase
MKISGAFAAASAATFAVAARTAAAFSPAPSRPAAVARTTTTTTTALSASVDDKTEVREYFNNEGFSRWNKIYSDSDEVNTVQLDIRKGHDMTIQKILGWVSDDGDIAGKTVCDCGCGVGSLAIPLAQMGEFHSRSRRDAT